MLHNWIVTAADDWKWKAALLLVALDVVLGVLAAIKTGNFRLGRLADVLKDDVLFKLIPYFAIYGAAIVVGGTNVAIPGLKLDYLADTAWVFVAGTLAASILSSLAELGFPVVGTAVSKLPKALSS